MSHGKTAVVALERFSSSVAQYLKTRKLERLHVSYEILTVL